MILDFGFWILDVGWRFALPSNAFIQIVAEGDTENTND